jgi:hypothetical protein
MLNEHFIATYGLDPEQLVDEDSDGIAYVRLDASWLVGFAMTDAEMVEIEAARAARDAAC